MISALWAIALNLVMAYGPQRRILICAMGHSAGFCFALWTIAQELVMCYGPSAKPITIAQNHTNFFEKLAKFFEGAVRLKSEHI
jgi:hypothetical protein